MARRVVRLALIYALLVLLAPADADGAFFDSASSPRPRAVSSDRPPAVRMWMLSGGGLR
jgi:hypothetical protein